MAERKPGPVKPPVIDLTAREATDSQAPDAGKPASTRTRPSRARPASTAKEPVAPTPDSEPVARPPSDQGPVAEPPGVASPPASDLFAERSSEPEPTGEPEAAPAEPATAAPPPSDMPAAQARPPSEATAEDASASAGADRADDAPDAETPAEDEPLPPPQPAPLPPPRPPARLAMPWSAISIAALGGAILGAGLTYLLANWIALPTQRPQFEDPTPALTALADRSAAIETRLGNVEATARNTQVSLDATLVQIDASVAELRQAIDDVANRIPTAQPVDLGGIEQQLRTLESRVDAIAAGASSADASALAERVVGIEETLGALSDQITAFAARLERSESSLAALSTAVEEAKAAVAAQNRTIAGAEVAPAVRLPLVLSGLEAAFASGRPYAAELSSLRTLLPDLAVPAPVAAAAETGLMRPDALTEQFEAAVPSILAGRTGASTGDWTQDALEWAKALLALRPAEEIEGETPEAIVSRLEGAVKRHDYIAAAGLLAQLPEPMRAAAGELGEAIAAHAAADRLVADLRAQALTPDAADAGAAP